MRAAIISNMKLIIKPFRVFRVVRGSLLAFPKATIQSRKTHEEIASLRSQ